MDIEVLNQKSLSIIFTSSANKYILKLMRFLVNFVRPFFKKKKLLTVMTYVFIVHGRTCLVQSKLILKNLS